MLVSAPEAVRDRYRGMATDEMMRSLRRRRTCRSPLDQATYDAMRSLAAVWSESKAVADELEAKIAALVAENAPALLAIFGCGPLSAAILAMAAGDNPDRLGGEAAFASLCGVSPIEASSGKTARHRLNRGGNRQANAALHRIAVVRLRYDERTREYAERKRSEGKSNKETIRCLKRYIAREVYKALLNPKGV